MILIEKLKNYLVYRDCEVMTIMIYFHQSSYRNFKAYYQEKIIIHHQRDFPFLVSYNRFIELIPYTLMPHRKLS